MNRGRQVQVTLWGQAAVAMAVRISLQAKRTIRIRVSSQQLAYLDGEPGLLKTPALSMPSEFPRTGVNRKHTFREDPSRKFVNRDNLPRIEGFLSCPQNPRFGTPCLS